MAKKKRKPARAIALELRKIEAKKRQLAADRDKLFALSPGGSPGRPLSVDSPAVIETKAGKLPCPQCEGSLRVDDHSVDREKDELLRIVRAHCRQCQAPRSIWFRVVPDMSC